ncbi:single strand DNA binding protein [Gordonia phage GMA6]|uniref:Uncharacterized protein n=1 Tax=Gordonia phage GMA6 TaxID=1647285 RepID=A0A0K0NLC1_9CAUD|nr:single strand DNA binding protein [Gordonia phage GMA6]AKL88352.1 hypothetical protein GMA6_71 [Gordonia phage GMA6]
MVLVKASKAGSIKKLKSSLKKGGGGAFIRNVPKDGSLTVRFLTEPEEWVEYQEYYVEGMEPAFFPAFEGLDPDVVAEARKPSKRYLACVVDRDSNEVVPVKMPKSLVESLMKKYDKYETIMDRDYELVRDGEGFDTTYEAIPEAPKKMNVSQYDVLDLMDVLNKQVPSSLTGEDDDDEDEDDTPPWKDDDKPVASKRRGKLGSKTSTPAKKTRGTAARRRRLSK